MEAIAHNKAFAKKVGVPQSVGQEFSKADKGKTFKKEGGIMATKKMKSGGVAASAMGKVTAGGKIILRKLAAEMDLPITARLNDATVLLKSVKG